MLGRIKTLLTMFLAVLLLTVGHCAFAEGEFLIKYAIPDKAGKILVLGGESSKKIDYEITKLAEPNRVVIDIKNSILLESRKNISLKNKTLADDIKIAQFSTDPNIVRVVFSLKSPDDHEKIKINTYRNSLVFEVGDVELAKIKSPSIYRDKESRVDIIEDNQQEIAVSNVEKQAETRVITLEENQTAKPADKLTVDKPEEKKPEQDNRDKVLKEIQDKFEHNITINTVELKDNRVLISGAGIISVTEPFVLDSPQRVIYDIVDAVVSKKELIKTFTLKNNDTIRVAQFNPKTVRIVIETSKPDKYSPVISPDLQSIIIAPSGEVAFSEFPDNNVSGGVQEIKISQKDEQSTTITLISENPIIHNIKRSYTPDSAAIELFNIKIPPDSIYRELEKTGQFHGFMISELEDQPDGSKWRLQLNRTTKIESKLSLDGRILEITLKDGTFVPMAGLAPVRKKILIDPGHGGYDPGAHRDGIFEKDIALDVAKRVKQYLDKQGFYTVLTRGKDETISLKERVNITLRENPDLFVSIHVNASKNPNIKGIETHWYTSQSRPLAMHVQDKMISNLVTPDRGLKRSRFYVLRNTSIPSVLAEIGYISNETERYQIITEERKESTAKAIAEGIMSYIEARSGGNSSSGRQKL